MLERLITGRHGNPAGPERAKRHFVPSPQRIKREIRKLGLSDSNGDGHPTAAVPTDMLRTTTVYSVSAIGLHMGRNTLHMIGLGSHSGIVLRKKVSRGSLASRLANLPPYLVGIGAGLAWRHTMLLVDLPCLATT